MVRKFRSAIAVALIVASISSAHALSNRTFLATTGSDANACSVAAPCRTLQAALNATTEGGTIIILDSGGYGTNQTINKSVRVIANPGIIAEIVGSGVNNWALSIYLASPSSSVRIEGLRINGTASANGLIFSNFGGLGGVLSLHDVHVTADGAGILNGNQTGVMSISHSSVSRATGCIGTVGSSGDTTNFPTTVIDDTVVSNCSGTGISASYSSRVTAQHVTVSGKGFTTEHCFASFDGATMSLDSVTATACSTGLRSSGSSVGGYLAVSNSVITGTNVAGDAFYANVARTLGNNQVFRNGNDILSGFSALNPK